MTRDNVTLSAREQQWGQVLTQVLEGRLLVREAARLLGHSIRHIRRLLARVRTHGPGALAHGNRGRASPRRLAEKIRARIVALARGLYAGCNDSHFSELLAEREGLRVSRAPVQRVLRQAGIGSPRTRRPDFRREERRSAFGSASCD
jgi:transposase